MMLIDADEIRIKPEYMHDICGCMMIRVEDIARIINDMPTIEPQKWIPCSERLPDVAQRVLLSGHGKVMVGRLHSFGKYSLEPTGISYIYPKDAIEAWMPLPEPWKGEEQ